MERKCPKCGGKLGIFDLKPNCPHCGCSIMYYDMDKRLEEDSVKAEAEWQKLDEILDKITPAFIKKKRAAREEKEKNEKDYKRKIILKQARPQLFCGRIAFCGNLQQILVKLW